MTVTEADVDACITVAEMDAEGDRIGIAARVLAAEVKRMRSEPIYARMVRVNGQLREVLGKVEELPAKWIEAARTTNDKSSPSHLVDCAEELSDALRGIL